MTVAPSSVISFCERPSVLRLVESKMDETWVAPVSLMSHPERLQFRD
mgnify:CR=1 FL=1